MENEAKPRNMALEGDYHVASCFCTDYREGWLVALVNTK